MLWCINICLWLKFKQSSVAARHNRKPTSKGKCLLQHWPKQRLPASKTLASARPAGAYHKVPGRPPPCACRPSREMVNSLRTPSRPRLHWQPGMRVPGMRGTPPRSHINPSLSERPQCRHLVLSAQPLVCVTCFWSWAGVLASDTHTHKSSQTATPLLERGGRKVIAHRMSFSSTN